MDPDAITPAALAADIAIPTQADWSNAKKTIKLPNGVTLAYVEMGDTDCEPTLLIQCDVIEPSDGKGYDRDPRSIAKRGEAYLKSTGIADVAYFGPEPEFFIFDAVQWKVEMGQAFYKISSEEAPWSTPRK